MTQKLDPPSDPFPSAQAENILKASGDLDILKEHTELHLPGGQILRIPTSFLIKHPEPETAQSAATPDGAPESPVVIPVIEEQLNVSKRTVVTGKVLLEKHIQQYEETVDIPLASRTFDVERIHLNRPVPAPPPVRQEGDTTIYSLVEEQLVVTTQYILKGEVRVTQRDGERHDIRTVTLNREVLTVTRSPVGPAPEVPQS